MMETARMRYCVEYTLKGPSTDFYEQQEYRFFEYKHDAGKFLDRIDNNIGYETYAKNPILFFCDFTEVIPSVTKSILTRYRSTKLRENLKDQQDSVVALGKLTEREKKLLGIK